MDSLLDATIEAADEGVDTVKSNLTGTLGDNLTLTSPSIGSGQAAASIDGTGNVIIGNVADNTLTALEGTIRWTAAQVPTPCWAATPLLPAEA